MPRKVIVFGCEGFFGRAVVRALLARPESYQTIAISHQELDITKESPLQAALKEHQPNLVVNAAGITGNANCSKDPVRAWKVNSTGAYLIGCLCSEYGTVLVHPSSVVVFKGEDGYYDVHQDPKPQKDNIYAETKAHTEGGIRVSEAQFIMPRITMAYGPPHERDTTNFLKTVITALKTKGSKAQYFADQFTNPVHIDDAAVGIIQLMDQDFRGIVHFGGPEMCSMYDFAVQVKKIFNLTGMLEQGTVVGTTYPPHMTLNPQSSRKLGITFCGIEEGLSRCKAAMES